MPTISSRTALTWDGIASGHKMVVDDNTANTTKSMDYDELKKLFGTKPVNDTGATLTITYPGRYIFTGSANTVWTLPAGSVALDGLPFVWVNKSSNTSTVTLKNSAAVTQIVLPKNVIKQGYWDNETSQWIIY